MFDSPILEAIKYILERMSFDLALNVISGLVLAALLLLIRDKLFPPPDLNGLWQFTEQVERTTYNPYKEMKLTYISLVWLEGNTLLGTGEKIKTQTPDKTQEHWGAERIRISIRGAVYRRYFGKDRIIVHFEERGEKRESSTIHELRREKDSLVGRFTSTAANCSGRVVWTRAATDFFFEPQGPL